MFDAMYRRKSQCLMSPFVCGVVVLGLSTVITFGAGARPQLAATKTTTVWVVKQVTSYTGGLTLYIGDDFVKAVTHDGELAIITHAPKWNVVMYRKSENRGLELTYEKWNESGLGLMTSKRSLELGSKSNYFDPVLKVNCTKVDRPCSGRFYEANDPSMFRGAARQELRRLVYRCATSIPMSSKKISKFVTSIYNVPDNNCVPLELAYYCTDGSILKPYSTKSVEKEQLPVSLFAYPVGYKKVSDRAEMTYSKKQFQQVRTFLDSYMIDEPKNPSLVIPPNRN